MARYVFIVVFSIVISAAYDLLGPTIGIAMLSGVVGGLAWDFIQRTEGK